MFCFVLLCFVMSCYVMLCYVMYGSHFCSPFSWPCLKGFPELACSSLCFSLEVAAHAEHCVWVRIDIAHHCTHFCLFTFQTWPALPQRSTSVDSGKRAMRCSGPVVDGGGASLGVPVLLFPPEFSRSAEAALSNLHSLVVAESNDEPCEHVEPGGKAKRWIA